MDQDKENVKAKSRNPLPQAPLSLSPRYLLKNRAPLNTLAGPNGHNHNEISSFNSSVQCLAGPSNASANRPNSPFEIDTKYVTVWRGCSNPIRYLRDDKRRISEPSDSSGDEKENEKNIYFPEKDGLANKRRISQSTSSLNTLVPGRVKNIKRSLKRPHSRDLQGLTPLDKKEVADERVRRRLIQSPDVLTMLYTAYEDRQCAGAILSSLLHAETKHVSNPRVRSKTRAGVINWLMKVNGVDGNPTTIQTAVWYLDSVLATSTVTLENIQLVAAAAYWIATKLHGPLTPASKLVEYSNCAFTARLLSKTETEILVRLKFPCQPVVPQDYLDYFAWWCRKENPGEISVATKFLCLCGMMVNKSLCTEYPSVIAAASVRTAVLLLRKNELEAQLRSCPAYVAAKKKAGNLSDTCATVRHAFRAVAAKDYSYKFIFEQ